MACLSERPLSLVPKHLRLDQVMLQRLDNRRVKSGCWNPQCQWSEELSSNAVHRLFGGACPHHQHQQRVVDEPDQSPRGTGTPRLVGVMSQECHYRVTGDGEFNRRQRHVSRISHSPSELVQFCPDECAEALGQGSITTCPTP